MAENPTAFPSQALGGDGLPMEEPSYGMSLRDYFAAHALGGFFAIGDDPLPNGVTLEQYRHDVCKAIYGYADAMITERLKSSETGNA